MEPPATTSESRATVVVAGLANLLIAVAKLVAGLLANSSAMLAEGAHSAADTTTEVLLFTALRRGNRAADQHHPFGHGKEHYVWAFIAAQFTFVVGAGFSITEGVEAITGEVHANEFLISYVVLAVSFVMESVSLYRAVGQVRGAARHWRVPPARFLRHTADTSVKAVVLEDSAGLIGLVLATLGVGLSELTGDHAWDGVASVAIGVLLLVVAAILARSNISLLVGRAVPARVRAAIEQELTALSHVQRVDTLLTMQLGPDNVLVAAKVDFADDATGTEIEAAADEAERRLTDRYPTIEYVFLDPTRRYRRPGWTGQGRTGEL